MHTGKKVPRQQILVYRLYVYNPRRFQKAKDIIIKKLLTLAEILSN